MEVAGASGRVLPAAPGHGLLQSRAGIRGSQVTADRRTQDEAALRADKMMGVTARCAARRLHGYWSRLVAPAVRSQQEIGRVLRAVSKEEAELQTRTPSRGVPDASIERRT